MKFAILGAGAIGAYVGASLDRGGADVTLIARGAHLRAMQADGVHVQSPRGNFHARPQATDDVEAVSEADAVFVGLKAQALVELAPRIGSVLRPGAALIAAQNGLPWWYFHGATGPLDGVTLESVDPGGTISASIPPEAVIGCVIYCSTEIVSPGVIRHIEGTRFAIGEPGGVASDRCTQIARAFVAGGLKCPIARDIREQIWLKLVGNAAFNPVSALTGATLGELGTQPGMVALLRAIIEECTEVAGRLWIELPVSVERRLEAGIAIGDHKTSMLQDLEAGKRLELDCMTGAIIELAEHLGVAVPHTSTVHACATLLESVRTV